MPTVAVALLSLLVLGIWVVVSDARDRQRHLFYAGSYDLHDFPHAGAAAWKYCDDPTRPRRIACAAGWDGTGHNWLWYPLLGRDLQNEVTYVPVTVSGQVVEYGQTSELQKQADFVSWLRRLMKERIDTVVCLPPEPIEVVWARQHPDVLKQVSGEDETHVYVLQTAAAEGLLAGQASGKDTSETGAVLGQREKRTLQSTNPP
jgi:hypothetical protein